MMSLTPVVKKILIVMAVVFLVQSILIHKLGFQSLLHIFGFWPQNFMSGFVWQPLTYAFFHADIAHLFFNGLGLFFFACNLEKVWGQKKFLYFFMITAVGAALFHFLVFGITSFLAPEYAASISQYPTIGVSGVVYATLWATYKILGNIQIYLFMAIPMKLKHMVIAYVVYDLYNAIFSPKSSMAHLFHLGGLVTGMLLLYFFGVKLEKMPSINFRCSRKLSREEVKQRLSVVVDNSKYSKKDNGDDDPNDPNGGGGKYPKHWN